LHNIGESATRTFTNVDINFHNDNEITSELTCERLTSLSRWITLTWRVRKSCVIHDRPQTIHIIVLSRCQLNWPHIG